MITSNVTHRRFAPRSLENASGGGDGPAMLTIVSGKGGVGKSVVAHNLAIATGRSGVRTLLVDLDWQFGNLHVLANAVVNYDLKQAVGSGGLNADSLTTIAERVSLLASASVDGLSPWPGPDELQALFISLAQRLPMFDLIIVDTPPGANDQLAAVAEVSDEMMLIVNPELSAISAAYAQYKWLFQKLPELTGSFLVNRVSGADEAQEIGKNFVALTARFLDRRPRPLGYLVEDRALTRAVARQRSVFGVTPMPVIARQVSTLAGLVLERVFRNRTGAQRGVIGAQSLNLIQQTDDSRE